MRLLADRASVALTVLFFLALESLTTVTKAYWPLFGAFVFVLLLGTVVTLAEALRMRGAHVLILPLVYIGSVFLFHLFVSRGIFQQLFIVLATVGLFLLVARGVEWAFPRWNWFFTSGTFFLFVAGSAGLRFHLRFPLWAVVLMVGAVTFLLALHVLGRTTLTAGRRCFWSAFMTLMVLELLGAFALLPLSYLVVAGVLFVVFYVVLHLLQQHLYHHLTPRLVGEYLILGTIAVGLTLGTARWAVL